MDKVEAITARCNVAENFITFLVFEDQVFVKLLFFDLTRLGRHVLYGQHKVPSTVQIFTFQSSDEVFGWRWDHVSLALLMLTSDSPDRSMAADFLVKFNRV